MYTRGENAEFLHRWRLKGAALRATFTVAIFSLLFVASASAQGSLYQQYIERYKDIAIREMQRYGIPASITLAQGLLESGAGTSALALKANNHFGIKTGGTWDGPYYVKDDDSPNERFRAYSNAVESFEDHSLFLKSRSRYASLFTLSPTDYEGWARGLKAAGYATNPEYANKLISIIQIYNLHQYDLVLKAGAAPSATQKKHHHEKTIAASSNTEKPMPQASRALRTCNGIPYIVSQKGDTWQILSQLSGKSESKLRSYNELPSTWPLREGSIIFLKKKSSHVDSSLRGSIHHVKAGESLYTISQRYAITLKSLYKKNDLSPDFQPMVGDQLLLP